MSEADAYPEWTDAQWAEARKGAPWLWGGEAASDLLRDAIADLEAAPPRDADALAKLRAALAALEPAAAE
ncbi:MAG: hypothetical protein ACFCUS_00060 [Rubrimonas sp.]|uniref:hypothetical protein n=1 Tax=Rubrimonas sp. TaxID=2036015 RepID=UPI002FDCD040